jgi:hypothetical protein
VEPPSVANSAPLGKKTLVYPIDIRISVLGTSLGNTSPSVDGDVADDDSSGPLRRRQ